MEQVLDLAFVDGLKRLVGRMRTPDEDTPAAHAAPATASSQPELVPQHALQKGCARQSPPLPVISAGMLQQQFRHLQALQKGHGSPTRVGPVPAAPAAAAASRPPAQQPAGGAGAALRRPAAPQAGAGPAGQQPGTGQPSRQPGMQAPDFLEEDDPSNWEVPQQILADQIAPARLRACTRGLIPQHLRNSAPSPAPQPLNRGAAGAPAQQQQRQHQSSNAPRPEPATSMGSAPKQAARAAAQRQAARVEAAASEPWSAMNAEYAEKARELGVPVGKISEKVLRQKFRESEFLATVLARVGQALPAKNVGGANAQQCNGSSPVSTAARVVPLHAARPSAPHRPAAHASSGRVTDWRAGAAVPTQASQPASPAYGPWGPAVARRKARARELGIPLEELSHYEMLAVGRRKEETDVANAQQQDAGNRRAPASSASESDAPHRSAARAGGGQAPDQAADAAASAVAEQARQHEVPKNSCWAPIIARRKERAQELGMSTEELADHDMREMFAAARRKKEADAAAAAQQQDAGNRHAAASSAARASDSAVPDQAASTPATLQARQPELPAQDSWAPAVAWAEERARQLVIPLVNLAEHNVQETSAKTQRAIEQFQKLADGSSAAAQHQGADHRQAPASRANASSRKSSVRPEIPKSQGPMPYGVHADAAVTVQLRPVSKPASGSGVTAGETKVWQDKRMAHPCSALLLLERSCKGWPSSPGIRDVPSWKASYLIMKSTGMKHTYKMMLSDGVAGGAMSSLVPQGRKRSWEYRSQAEGGCGGPVSWLLSPVRGSHSSLEPMHTRPVRQQPRHRHRGCESVCISPACRPQSRLEDALLRLYSSGGPESDIHA